MITNSIYSICSALLASLVANPVSVSENIEGNYMERCLRSKCESCLSVHIRSGNEFVWYEFSPCGSEKIWGHWSFVDGKHADTLLIESTQRITFGRDFWDTLEIDNTCEKLKNEKWLIDEGKLYLWKDTTGKFREYYLSRQ